MKLKIVSDGTVMGTQLTAADGTPVQGISKIEVTIDAAQPFVTALVEFTNLELDITADVEENKVLVGWAERDGDEWVVHDADSETGQHITQYQQESHFKTVFPIYDRPEGRTK